MNTEVMHKQPNVPYSMYIFHWLFSLEIISMIECFVKWKPIMQDFRNADPLVFNVYQYYDVKISNAMVT